MLKVTAARVDIHKNLGEISEKKTKLLGQDLSSYFPDVRIMGDRVLFLHSEKRQALSVSQNQASVLCEPGDLLRAADVGDIIERLFDVLLLDGSAQVTFYLAGNFPITDGNANAMERSWHFADAYTVTKLKEIDGVVGLGVRCIVSRKDLRGDFRIEPFIADPKYGYMEFAGKFENPLAVSEIALRYGQVYDEFTGSLYSVARTLLGEKS